jgi:FkbM family methyltransferase
MPTKIAKAVNSLLEPLGIEIRRSPGSRASDDYYPVVPSCQVPYLSYKDEQFFGRRTDGWFVEIGAFDGYSYSNTWGLANRSWRGVMVEPIAEYAERCRQIHANHPGVQVLETAVSGDDSGLNFRIGGAFTTASPEQISEFASRASAVREMTDRQVHSPSQTLNQVLSQTGVPKDFDLLVVDVEGHEKAVFEGFDVSAWNPKMMIVELADVHPQLTALRAEQAGIYKELSVGEYVVVYKDSINTIFVREDVYANGVLTAR